MAMQRSDAVKALRTKTAYIAVVKRRLDDAFCEKVRRSANEKIVHGNCRFWRLSLAAPARRVNAWRRNRGHQPVRSVWISRRKTNHDECHKPCNATSAAHA